MISIAIVDDEKKARDTIANILGLSPVGYSIAGEAGSVASAFNLIVEKRPDVVLLDINLPDGTGFDLLRKFETVFFKVIFITAHEEYALKAIKFSALDYILKPITSGDLLLAVQKAAEAIRKEENGIKINAFLSNMDKIRKIVLKTSESIHIVQIKNIIRCEADVNYTHFYLDNGQHLIVSRPLKEFSEMLEPTGFFRTHQSHLVNLDHVLRFDKAEGGHLVMADNTQVPVSQRKREELFSLFQNL